MVVILLGNGFEEIEAIAPYDLLKRADIDVQFAGIGGHDIIGSHGIRLTAEQTVDMINAQQIEMLVLPGGLGGVRSISESTASMALIKQVWDNGGKIAAICAAPTILAALNIISGSKATCYPGMEKQMADAKVQNASVVTDGRLITARAAGSALDFGLALITMLKGEATAKKVATGVVYC